MLKKALITGSAKGIGRAIALELAQQGFDLAFHYLHSETLAREAQQEAEQFGVKAIALQGDVTKPQQAQKLVTTAATALEGLSVIVNNVGDFVESATADTSFEDWHHALDSNLNSAFYVTQTAIPYLKQAGGGRIINFALASAQHLIAGNKQTAYRIAKTGIIIYSRSLAKELITHNITVNVIAPGAAENTIGLEEIIDILPLKRPATLEEICHGVRFFVSEKSSYITGQVLEIAGGWRL